MKKYVLPTLKVLIAVVIALALAKIAFFPSKQGQERADISSGLEVSTRTTTATVGDITSTVEVKGQIVQDKAVEAKATLTGTVDSLAVAKDALVTQGEPLLYIKKTEPSADGGEKTTEDILAEGLLRSKVLRVALREVIDTLSKLSIERDRYEEYRVRTADLLLVGISVGDDIP